MSYHVPYTSRHKNLITSLCLIALAIGLIIAIPGCSKSDPVKEKVEEQPKPIHPKIMGTLPDGHTLQEVIIHYESGRNQFVYFVGPGTTVNTEVRTKSHSEPTVTINGKEMSLDQAVIELNAAATKYHEQELARLRSQPKGN